jgi:hypothetical protein
MISSSPLRARSSLAARTTQTSRSATSHLHATTSATSAKASSREAVFCGECSMTYCLPCDSRYHTSGDDLGLRSHFRQSLHGEMPRAIARAMNQLAKEEEDEAEDQAERMTRQSVYSARTEHDAEVEQKRMEMEQAQREANMPLARSLNSEYAGASGYAAASQLSPSNQLGQSRTVSFHDYSGHANNLRSSPPPAAGDATWSHTQQQNEWNPSAAAQLAKAYPIEGAYAQQQQQQSTQQWGGTQASPYASTVPRQKLRRPASATPVGHVPKTTMVLKSTRPPSASATSSARELAWNGQTATVEDARFVRTSANAAGGASRTVGPRHTRMSVSNPTFTTLPGKARFGTTMLLHSSSAAMVHQLVPGKRASTTGEKGAHSIPARWGDLDRTAVTLREMNDQMMSIKLECTTMLQAKEKYKTAVLKKQRALKEIARIATNLAKQPNATPGSMGSSSHSRPLASGRGSSLETSRRGPAELQERVKTTRTTNEILRLEIEQLQAKMTVLRDSAEARTTGVKELGNLERERRALVKQVSVDAAARELDGFKQSQMVADLEFAVKEMQRAVEEKKKAVAETKMQRMQAESATRAMQQEYQVLQQKLDRASAQAVAGQYDHEY